MTRLFSLFAQRALLKKRAPFTRCGQHREPTEPAPELNMMFVTPYL